MSRTACTGLLRTFFPRPGCKCMLEPFSETPASTSYALSSLSAPHQPHRSYAAAAGPSEDDPNQPKESVSQRKRKRKPDAWRTRLPAGAGRYGTKLSQQRPDQFERMRVILGYYDQIEHHQLPKQITINNLQTLCLLDSIDPYYKLSLLSYRSKLLNQELAAPLQNTNRFLDELAVAQSEFRPIIPGLGLETVSSSSSSSSKTGNSSASESSSEDGSS